MHAVVNISILTQPTQIGPPGCVAAFVIAVTCFITDHLSLPEPHLVSDVIVGTTHVFVSVRVVLSAGQAIIELAIVMSVLCYVYVKH